MDAPCLSGLRFTKKSHRKQISYPAESPELAEAMGIIFGDGGINNSWQLTITLNSEADLEYSCYVRTLIGSLFGIGVAARKRPGKKALVLVCSSTNLVEFLVAKGAVRGNKIAQKLDIPLWVKSDPALRRAFVRGIFDTDGCLYIHKHTVQGKEYRNLGFCFSSYSAPLLFSVSEILLSFGICPSKRSKDIWLYSYRAIEKYLEIFGTSNPRISRKYEEWTNFRKMDNIGT